MVESWRQHMLLGIVHPMAYPAAADEAALLASVEEVCLDEFFDVLEVKPSDSATHTKLRAIAEQSATHLIVASQPPLLGAKLSLNDPDEARREAAVALVKKSVDAAVELGAPLVAVLSGPDPQESEREKQMDLLVDSLAQCCRYGQDRSPDQPVWITLETFDHTIDKRCLIGPSDRARAVAERVREQAPNFGLTIDLSHLPLLGESPAECLEQVMDYLVHVHAGNCAMQEESHAAYGDLHPRFGMAGTENGVDQLSEFLASLIYSGYFKAPVPTPKPVLTFEVKPLPGESSQLVLAGTKRTFLRAWAQT